MRHGVLIIALLLMGVLVACNGGESYLGSRTLDVTEPHVGLDTIPFYHPNSFAFNTKSALEREKSKTAKALTVKAEEKKKVFEAIKKFEELGELSGMPDPWVPPMPIDNSDMPEAIRRLPVDEYGYVDWTAAVEGGMIRPKGTIVGSDPDDVMDLDILFKVNDALMANVLFSHKIHTSLLSCNNCHPSIFIPRKGVNVFNMYDVWKGEYCGKCHGKVAFQAKGFENCQRCHSVKKR
ncbi:MAG: cytochrome c3 family protein [Deltaproteobacteria bacterium]|nr:cytochrome c3 family protein [Deltaproteobacteria bacterium]